MLMPLNSRENYLRGSVKYLRCLEKFLFYTYMAANQWACKSSSKPARRARNAKRIFAHTSCDVFYFETADVNSISMNCFSHSEKIEFSLTFTLNILSIFILNYNIYLLFITSLWKNIHWSPYFSRIKNDNSPGFFEPFEI